MQLVSPERKGSNSQFAGNRWQNVFLFSFSWVVARAGVQLEFSVQKSHERSVIFLWRLWVCLWCLQQRVYCNLRPSSIDFTQLSYPCGILVLFVMYSLFQSDSVTDDSLFLWVKSQLLWEMNVCWRHLDKSHKSTLLALWFEHFYFSFRPTWGL